MDEGLVSVTVSTKQDWVRLFEPCTPSQSGMLSEISISILSTPRMRLVPGEKRGHKSW